jgi:hypothetical protein
MIFTDLIAIMYADEMGIGLSIVGQPTSISRTNRLLVAASTTKTPSVVTWSVTAD